MIQGVIRQSVLGLLVLFLLAPALAQEPEAGPEVTVDQLHQSLVEAMKRAEALGFAGRFDRLLPAVRSSFNTRVMGRITLGSHWKKLDEQQQARFVDVLTRLIAATYADRLSGYEGQVFSIESSKAIGEGRQLVSARLANPEGKDRELDYQLLLRDGNWRIFDVVADGVSDLSLKRAEYTGLMGDQGFEGLLARLEEKIAGYRNKPE